MKKLEDYPIGTCFIEYSIDNVFNSIKVHSNRLLCIINDANDGTNINKVVMAHNLIPAGKVVVQTKNVSSVANRILRYMDKQSFINVVGQKEFDEILSVLNRLKKNSLIKKL